MAILITGGAGYIGSHTCVALLEAGYHVVVVDNLANAKLEVMNRMETITGKQPKFYECDIRDEQGLIRVFQENTIEAVIHFAGLKAVGESTQKPLSYYDNNIAGTVTLCRVMEAMNVKNLVFSSSATVYGNCPIPYKETMETGDCYSPYGRTKFMIEEILKDVHTADPDWHIALLRYFNPIGAHPSGLMGEDPNGIPNNLLPYISQVAIGKLPQLSVYGDDYNTPDGTCIRDYIHVCDLADGHKNALEYVLNHAGIEAINLGGGKGSSVLELIAAFEKACGKPIPYRIAPRREGDLPAFYADPTKAKELLHWEVKRDVETMCEDTWRWQQQNPNGYEE